MTLVITEPGIYAVSREEYDADPVGPAPSLSCSVAKLLLERTAAHAFLAHPRLNKHYERESLRKYDLGTGAHALMLGEGHKIAVIRADDFRTKAARAEREDSLAAGKVPMLEAVYEEACLMIAAARRQLKRADEGQGVFEEELGRAEQTVVWQEGEGENAIWCRARPDWISKSGNIVADYKTSGESANPERWVRTLYNVQGDLQPAHYLRGLRAATRKSWYWIWIVQEIEPPYALSVCTPSEPMLELAAAKMDMAYRKWAWCLRNNSWPGYPTETAHLGALPWEERKMLERLEREAVRKELEKGKRLAMQAQAPDGWQEDDA